jgi:hypothetical protein
MFKKIVLASAVLFGSTIASNAAVIYSDNFNAAAQGLGFAPLTNAPAGWVVDYGSVDVIGTGFFDFYPGNGNYIDMNGSTGQSGGIHTSTVFNFMAGITYTVNFDYGNNANSANNTSTETLVADVLGFPGVTINQVGSIANFLSGTFSFTPLVNFASALYFKGSGTNDGDNGGLILDNVSLSAVPVPAALPLFAAGLGMLGLAGRRRRAKSAA